MATGTTWLIRDDRAAYLKEAVEPALEAGLSYPIYADFLQAVVVPHAAWFALFATVGELLTGFALLIGYPVRAGAVGALFFAGNDGLAFGSTLLPPGATSEWPQCTSRCSPRAPMPD